MPILNRFFSNPVKLHIIKYKIQNVIGLKLGLIIWSMINMSIILISDNMIPLPTVIDPVEVNSLSNNIHLF